MPRTKSAPTKTATSAERAANRTPRPIGWQENAAWWLGKGRTASKIAWENAPTLTMTDVNGAVLFHNWEAGYTPLPLTRGCVQAFSHPDSTALVLSLPGGKAQLLSDKAYQSLVKDLTADCNSIGYDEVFALPKPDLLVVFYRYAMLGPEELRKWEDAAAVSAGSALREAVATKDCTWVTLQLALNILLLLPPRVSITQHAAVAALLNDPDELPTVLTYAAHTLACMGPRAVTEHYEEIMSIARAGGECVAAAWLCVCVLTPYELLRLEARGAPVSSLCAAGSPFADDEMVDALLVGEGHGTAHRNGFPQTHDLRAALHRAATAREYRPVQESAEEFSEWVDACADYGSVMTRFVPVNHVWTAAAHATFPVGARHRAIEVLMIGVALSRGMGADRHSGVALAALPVELWVAFVIGHVVRRRSKPGGAGEAGEVENLAECARVVLQVNRDGAVM